MCLFLELFFVMLILLRNNTRGKIILLKNHVKTNSLKKYTFSCLTSSSSRDMSGYFLIYFIDADKDTEISVFLVLKSGLWLWGQGQYCQTFNMCPLLSLKKLWVIDFILQILILICQRVFRVCVWNLTGHQNLTEATRDLDIESINNVIPYHTIPFVDGWAVGISQCHQSFVF